MVTYSVIISVATVVKLSRNEINPKNDLERF